MKITTFLLLNTMAIVTCVNVQQLVSVRLKDQTLKTVEVKETITETTDVELVYEIWNKKPIRSLRLENVISLGDTNGTTEAGSICVLFRQTLGMPTQGTIDKKTYDVKTVVKHTGYLTHDNFPNHSQHDYLIRISVTDPRNILSVKLLEIEIVEFTNTNIKDYYCE